MLFPFYSLISRLLYLDPNIAMFTKDCRCLFYSILVFLFVNLIQSNEVEKPSKVVVLTSENIDKIIEQNKVVFINFYADWCRFSQMLAPIFKQTADILSEEFPNNLVLGKVDCEVQEELSRKYGISKYPTLKVIRNGKNAKKEFRGQRSVDALSKFIKDLMSMKMNEFHQLSDLKPDEKKRSIVGFFENRESENYLTFEKVADELRDDCEFHVGFGDASIKERPTGDNIKFVPPNKGIEIMYTGKLNNFNGFLRWATDKCIPLVREITFENAEELTEEGLPFLLMFHSSDDTESVKIYKDEVAKQLLPMKDSINFLIADGNKFAHPLKHLGKTTKDLPVIAIDSFRHMYLFPKFEDIYTPGKLKQFIHDLHSGKLHREFHHGPDPVVQQPVIAVDGEDAQQVGQDGDGAPPATDDNMGDQGQQKPDEPENTDPPETVFKKLAPSEQRYTLLRDEL